MCSFHQLSISAIERHAAPLSEFIFIVDGFVRRASHSLGIVVVLFVGVDIIVLCVGFVF